METLSQNLSTLFNTISFFKKSMNHFIKEYDYCILSTDFMKEDLQKIINFANKSEIIILNEYEQQNAQFNYKFLIIGFEKNIIFVEQSSFELINQIFACKSNLSICFFNNSKKYFDKFTKLKYTETKTDLQFLSQISNFEEKLSKKSLKQPLLKIWKLIYPCIFGYKIKKSYVKSFQNRIINFKIDDKSLDKTEEISYDDIIEFGSIGSTQQFNAVLAYHVEKEELLAIKKKKNGIGNENENDNLKKREIENYKEISHPFVPKFYGTIKESNDLVIEFINGNTLDNIKSLHLDEKVKINFILELILVFEYLQSKNFVYRDLKQNNIIIDENKIAVLIDYDRMIKYSNSNDIISNENYTADLISSFLAP